MSVVRGLLVILGGLGSLGPLMAHPSSPNQAIAATTIALLTIQEKQAQLRLEIGAADRPYFEHLLRDGVQRSPTPQQQDFFERRLILTAGDEVLMGRVTLVEPRRRVKRDAITGEALPPSVSSPSEPVTYAEVVYDLSERITELLIRQLPNGDGINPTIGLVVFHKAIPINDFDFLKWPVSCKLNWSDPWKSAFKGQRFRRYYNSPIWATLSVEPRGIRLEVVARPELARSWSQAAASASLQEQAHLASVTLLRQLQIIADDKPLSLTAEPPQRLQQTIGKIGPTTAEDIPPEAAFILMSYSGSLPQRPREVELKWTHFTELVTAIPLWVNTSQAANMLSPQKPTYTWRDRSDPEDANLPQRQEVSVNSTSHLAGIVALGLLMLAALVGLPWLSLLPRWGRLCLMTLAAVSICVICWVGWPNPRDSVPLLSQERAPRVVHRLLSDAVRAFDCRDEEEVYDTLAESVSGELLREAYLSIRRMLDTPSIQGRARVREVVVESAEAKPLHDGLYQVRATWTMEVALTHWGHSHLRTSRYEGELVLKPSASRWKLDKITVLDERLAETPALPRVQP